MVLLRSACVSVDSGAFGGSCMARKSLGCLNDMLRVVKQGACVLATRLDSYAKIQILSDASTLFSR